MKILVQAAGNTSDSLIDNRFGRCNYFMIYDTDTKEYKVQENMFKDGSSGVGIKVAQFVSENADVIIGTNIGPKAFDTVAVANIKVFNGESGISIEENIKKYLNNELDEFKIANAEGHHQG